MTLTQMGIETPFTVTAQPNATRIICATATSKKMIAATVEMGFNWHPRCTGQAGLQQCHAEKRTMGDGFAHGKGPLATR